MTGPLILSIGHSTHNEARFIALLGGAGVTAIADVRSSPWSRNQPQFNQETLRSSLNGVGIAYAFLGEELGGRPTSKNLYSDGVADYEKMALTAAFNRGLDRVIDGAKRFRIALMCSERDPLDCHRCLLVGRALQARGAEMRHVLVDGSVLTHSEAEQQLLEVDRKGAGDLFMTQQERLVLAYRARARKVAYSDQFEAGAAKTAAG